MTNWINTVSRDHVQQGVRGRFTQANHGKPHVLRRMAKGDWIAFYSPKTAFEGGEPLQAFTAIGQIVDDEPYQIEVSPDFTPWRRNVDFLPATEAPIRPLIDDLNFIENTKQWVTGSGSDCSRSTTTISSSSERPWPASGRSVATVSNLDTAPVEETCSASPQPGIEVLTAREVPLGGPRAMRVRRTLPQRQRSLVGAWCFVDHYGPHNVRHSPGMVVPPHPHTGLQTVSWLFSGEIEHRDSGGVHALVRPGELNLMTAGAGICHSEVSTAATTLLHGVQLWVALPDSDRDTRRGFSHFVPQSVSLDSADLRVFLGQLQGVSSPIDTFTPLLGAQLDIRPDCEVALDVDPQFEHGVLLDQGDVEVAAVRIGAGELACQGAGPDVLHIRNIGVSPARLMLLGGVPFTEDLVMWWNFAGRSHDDIVFYRRLWESGDDRFGAVEGYVGTPTRLPAPPLPTTRLKPRPAPGRKEGR